MKFIIQILVAILVGLIINDTLYFLYDESSRLINTQIDVRDPYETAEFHPFDPEKLTTEENIDEDASLGWLWIFATVAIGYLAYKARQRTQVFVASSKVLDDDDVIKEVVTPPSPPQPDEIEAKKEDKVVVEEVEKPEVKPLGESLIAVEPNVSFISTTYASSRPSDIIASDTDEAEASNVEFELRRVSAVPDFDNAFKYQMMRRLADCRNDRLGVGLSCTYSGSIDTSQRTTSYERCDCNIEQFEERLGVVEHGLKQTEEATKEWAKRIEQAEVDLVNLNRQMYNVLSNMEFKAPNSEAFTRDFKKAASCLQTFSTGDSYKFEETSLGRLYNSNNNWATIMESEVERKINEIKSILNKKVKSNQADSTHLQQSKLTIPSIDENVVEREELPAVKADEPGDTLEEIETVVRDEPAKDWTKCMKEEVEKKVAEMKQEMNAIDETIEMLPSLDETTDNGGEHCESEKLQEKEGDDLMTKTLEIIKDIEDVVYKEAPKVVKVTPKVPTHVVPPYKRISFAETDGTVSLARNNILKSNRHKSKFK